MDWSKKVPSLWDLTELEHETFSNLDTVGVSISFGDQHKAIKGDFSVDLKLGQLGDSGNYQLLDVLKQHGDPRPTSSSPSGASKRSRAAYSVSKRVLCLVDGCGSDLSTCRDYHRRHKVCEIHSKTPTVTINGQKQRFCQQCSRFHSLEEFDEQKRSCRKRLDGHNRRRRKPQPEALSRSGLFSSNHQGPQLSPFSSSLVYPSTSVVNPSWTSVVKAEANTGLHIKQQFAVFQSSNNKKNHAAPVCQPLLHTISTSDTCSSSGADASAASAKSEMCPDRSKTTRILPDSDCALSLLSSPQPQPQHQTSEWGPGHMIHHRLSLSGNNNSNNIEPMDSFRVSHGSSHNAHNIHQSSELFHMGSDGSQRSPFHWH